MTRGSTSFKTSQEMWYDCLYKAADHIAYLVLVKWVEKLFSGTAI